MWGWRFPTDTPKGRRHPRLYIRIIVLIWYLRRECHPAADVPKPVFLRKDISGLGMLRTVALDVDERSMSHTATRCYLSVD